MVKELELAAADAAAGLGNRRTSPHAAHPPPTHCLNCGSALHGRYCSQCGQSSDDHHRSIFHLMWEAVEGLTHLDGRLAATLPPLFFRPGRLARDHIEGRRARHVPPFRLFLISLLLFMLALEGVVHRGSTHGPSGPPHAAAASTGAGHPTAAPQRKVGATGGPVQIGAGTDPASSGQDGLEQFERSTRHHSPLGTWMIERIKRARDNREYYQTVAFNWGHRLAILLLPIFALLLTGLYFYKRQFFVYDHLVVSMQFLSFVFLLWAAVYLSVALGAPRVLKRTLFIVATLWVPVNLFMTLRGAYGSGIVGAGLKTAFLWVSTMVIFVLLILAILAVALNQI